MTLSTNYPDEIRRDYTRKIGAVLRQYAPNLSIPDLAYPAGLAFLVEQVLEAQQTVQPLSVDFDHSSPALSAEGRH